MHFCDREEIYSLFLHIVFSVVCCFPFSSYEGICSTQGRGLGGGEEKTIQKLGAFGGFVSFRKVSILDWLGDVSLFYISEFPDSTKAKDLHGLFDSIRKVVKVSITPRRNKVGKRFGFAKFKDVEDARLFAITLDNVQIGGGNYMLRSQGLSHCPR